MNRTTSIHFRNTVIYGVYLGIFLYKYFLNAFK